MFFKNVGTLHIYLSLIKQCIINVIPIHLELIKLSKVFKHPAHMVMKPYVCVWSHDSKNLEMMIYNL